MAITVSCNCGKTIKAKDSLGGKTVSCPNCQARITIPNTPSSSQNNAGDPPILAPPVTEASDLLMQCQCGQQFNVEKQYAGRQVNCPSCQVLCQIPGAVPNATPQPTPVLAPPVAQEVQHPPANPTAPPAVPPQVPGQSYPPGAQNLPEYGPPGYPQPAANGYPPNMNQPQGYGYPNQPSFPQPTYAQNVGDPSHFTPSFAHHPSGVREKTGISILIFAIAACVFSAGLILMLIWQLSTHVTSISNAMKTQRISTLRDDYEELQRELISMRSDRERRNEISKQIAEINKKISEIAKTSGSGGSRESLNSLMKIGAILQMLSLIAVVVATVFAIMSKGDLVGLAIANVCVAGVAFLLGLIFQSIPMLQEDSVPKSFFYCALFSRGLEVSDKILTFLVDGSILATFLLFAIFLMNAAGAKNNRRIQSGAKFSLISFIVAASVMLLLLIWCLVDFKSAAIWPMVTSWVIQWISNAAFVVGLVFLIINLFKARLIFRG